MNTTYDNYLGKILNLLDDEPVFEEFASPACNLDEELATKTNEFIQSVDAVELDNYIFNVTELITIKLMCDESNKNVEAEIGLTELGIFNEFVVSTLIQAKMLADKTNYNIDDVLLYGFTYANYLINSTETNHKTIKYYKKAVIKPIQKYFEKDYNYAYRLKYGVD